MTCRHGSPPDKCRICTLEKQLSDQKEEIEKLDGILTAIVQPAEWTVGVPPDFEGENEALIVAEIPSHFGVRSRYMVFRWDGIAAGWGFHADAKERIRATRWIRITLPPQIGKEISK